MFIVKMAKRKSRKVIKKTAKTPKLQKEFNCPFCRHTKCIEVSMDRPRLLGDLYCRICGVSFSTNITRLDEPVDVYSTWIDRSVEANEPLREYDATVSAVEQQAPSRSNSRSSSEEEAPLVNDSDTLDSQGYQSQSANNQAAANTNNRRRLRVVADDSDTEGTSAQKTTDLPTLPIYSSPVQEGSSRASEDGVLFGNDE